MKIVADDKIPYIKGVFEPSAEVVYLPGDEISNRDLKTADALLTRSITSCNEELLEGTSVRLIASATIGDDHIDKGYCSQAGIRWANAKGCNAGAVNQYVQAALLALSAGKNWKLEGKTLGIVGAGDIGSRVSETARALGMKVMLNDPPRQRAEGPGSFNSLREIQAEADVISFHVPLTYGGEDKTFHLADAHFFDGLAKKVLLLNTSRGAVVDTDALKKAVEDGRVSGLALDVWENEPNPDPGLIEIADIATPHIAGYSLEGKAMGAAMTVRAVSRFFNLGLDAWTPALDVRQVSIKLNCRQRDTEECLSEVFRKVYPVEADSGSLKNQPERFEELRRNYSFRKENHNFLLELENCMPGSVSAFRSLGFNINESN